MQATARQGYTSARQGYTSVSRTVRYVCDEATLRDPDSDLFCPPSSLDIADQPDLVCFTQLVGEAQSGVLPAGGSLWKQVESAITTQGQSPQCKADHGKLGLFVCVYVLYAQRNRRLRGHKKTRN
jgi:hypothetical protein